MSGVLWGCFEEVLAWTTILVSKSFGEVHEVADVAEKGSFEARLNPQSGGDKFLFLKHVSDLLSKYVNVKRIFSSIRYMLGNLSKGYFPSPRYSTSKRVATMPKC